MLTPFDLQVREDVRNRRLLVRGEREGDDRDAGRGSEARRRLVDEVHGRREVAVVRDRELGRVMRAGGAEHVEDDGHDELARGGEASRPVERQDRAVRGYRVVHDAVCRPRADAARPCDLRVAVRAVGQSREAENPVELPPLARVQRRDERCTRGRAALVVDLDRERHRSRRRGPGRARPRDSSGTCRRCCAARRSRPRPRRPRGRTARRGTCRSCRRRRPCTCAKTRRRHRSRSRGEPAGRPRCRSSPPYLEGPGAIATPRSRKNWRASGARSSEEGESTTETEPSLAQTEVGRRDEAHRRPSRATSSGSRA